MHALVLLCINQHTTFEVPSFTDFKDMTGVLKIKKRVTRSLICLHMNRKAHVAYNFNYLFKNEGRLKVTASHVH